MKLLLSTFALGLGFFAQAQAAPVIVEYQAKISYLFESRGNGEHAVETSNVIGFDISRNETFTGYLVYDTTTQWNTDGDGSSPQYYLPPGLHQQFLRFDNSPSLLTLGSGQGRAGESAQSEGEDAARGFTLEGGFNNGIANGAVYTTFVQQGTFIPMNGYFPQSSEWPKFSPTSTISVGYYANDFSGSARFEATMSSFRVVSAVPEPATYAMLGLGLSAIALLRRSRRGSAIRAV